MKKVILFTCLLFILQCDTGKEPNAPINHHPIPRLREEAFFPLEVGNFWTYQETTVCPESTSEVEYTARVVSVQKIGGYVWHRIVFSSVSQRSPRFLRAVNDSIFELQNNFNVPVSALQYFKPSRKEQAFQSLLGGDVRITKTATILDEPVSVPAGTFGECYLFTSQTPDWIEKEIVCSGVGVVQRELIHRTLMGDTTFVQRTVLVRYQVHPLRAF